MPGGFGPRFLLEALFLVLVAVVAGLADVPTRGIVLVMAAAWLLTAGVEWAASRERARVEREGSEARAGGESAPDGAERSRRTWLRRREGQHPVAEPPESTVIAPHVRVLPQEPDPAAQPVLERPAAEPEALVEASAAPERPPPPPEPARKPSPAVRAEPPQVERVMAEPPPTRKAPISTPMAEAPLPSAPDVEAPAEEAPALVAAPPLAPEPEVEQEPEDEQEPVVPLPFPATPREWNLWDLERLTRASGGPDVIRAEERAYLLMYLRDFASPDGILPADFDGLVRESFGDLLLASARP